MGGRPPNSLLARRAWGVAAALALSGCNVHHYHHFDNPPPAATALDAPRTLPRPAAAAPVPPRPDPAPPGPPAASPAVTPVSVGPTDERPVPPRSQPTPPDEWGVWRRAGTAGVSAAPEQPATLPDDPGGGVPRFLPAPTPLPPPGRPGGLPPAAEPPAAKLTVDQVINAVLVTDPRLRSGFEAINQAHASALTASLPPNPTLFTDIQLLPLTQPFTTTQQGGPPQYDLQVSQPIDWFLFGKRAANMAREALGVRAAESDYADLVRRRVLEAATGYYDVAEAVGLVDLAGQDVANLERVEAATRTAVEAGGRPQVDLNRVRLDLLVARRAARDAETTLVGAKARLRALIGRTDADPGFTVAGGLDAPPRADPPAADEAFALAVKNRPDVEARRRRVAQAGADTDAQARAAFPQVTPLLGYTRQYQHKAIGFPDASSWGAAVTMSLPLYDRNQGNRARAASAQAQARFDLQADLAAVRAEVETAAQEVRAARANAAAVADDQLRLAREVLDAVTTAYAAGGRPLLDVLDAERNFRDTNRTYIGARAAYWRAVYRFAAAIGQQAPPP